MPDARTGSIADILAWRAREQPDRLAYRFLADGTSDTAEDWTYRQVSEHADVVSRTLGALGSTPDEQHRALARSVCLSADAGHALHPNYPGRHDPANHPLLNGGPLLKLNANQRYASDAGGSALWRRACRRAGVPTQEFVSHNAIPCGSTIGPLTATRLGIATVDVGVPLLSMHSARELAGTEDPGSLSRAVGAFFALGG